MRIIPLAFIKEISDKTIEDVSAITHAHNISKNICVTSQACYDYFKI